MKSTENISKDESKVDSIIGKLLSVKTKQNKLVNLSLNEIEWLCTNVQEIFMTQPVMLEIASPVKICGDIHGQYSDLLHLFEYGGHPPQSNYLFLGDYVDRGKQSLECICLLFAYKIKFPNNFFLLRGNHESKGINRIYGFYDECKRRYNVSLWKKFTECFDWLPICALVEERILCMHGGISPDLVDIKQIQNISRPTDIPDKGLLCDLLWSDPDQRVDGWGENDRGVSVTFGINKVRAFLDNANIDFIARAHQVVQDGYEFFGDKDLVTIFSAPNYCGDFSNAGAIMNVDKDLVCSFQILKSAALDNDNQMNY